MIRNQDFTPYSTCVFVGDDPSTDVCLNEAVDHHTPTEHHAVVRLPCNHEAQAAVVTVRVWRKDVLGCDDCLLSLLASKVRFQTSDQHWDFVVDRRYLEITVGVQSFWSGLEVLKKQNKMSSCYTFTVLYFIYLVVKRKLILVNTGSQVTLCTCVYLAIRQPFTAENYSIQWKYYN